MILIAIAVIEAIIIAYLFMLHTEKIKDADKDFIPDSIETKVEEIQVNAVNKLNRLKAELKDVAESIKEVGNQLEDLPKSLKGKRAGRKANVKK
jgi:peptidoglycan hydrolase CwlO-like protein